MKKIVVFLLILISSIQVFAQLEVLRTAEFDVEFKQRHENIILNKKKQVIAESFVWKKEKRRNYILLDNDLNVVKENGYNFSARYNKTNIVVTEDEKFFLDWNSGTKKETYNYKLTRLDKNTLDITTINEGKLVEGKGFSITQFFKFSDAFSLKFYNKETKEEYIQIYDEAFNKKRKIDLKGSEHGEVASVQQMDDDSFLVMREKQVGENTLLTFTKVSKDESGKVEVLDTFNLGTRKWTYLTKYIVEDGFIYQGEYINRGTSKFSYKSSGGYPEGLFYIKINREGKVSHSNIMDFKDFEDFRKILKGSENLKFNKTTLQRENNEKQILAIEVFNSPLLSFKNDGSSYQIFEFFSLKNSRNQHYFLQFLFLSFNDNIEFNWGNYYNSLPNKVGNAMRWYPNPISHSFIDGDNIVIIYSFNHVFTYKKYGQDFRFLSYDKKGNFINESLLNIKEAFGAVPATASYGNGISTDSIEQVGQNTYLLTFYNIKKGKQIYALVKYTPN